MRGAIAGWAVRKGELRAAAIVWGQGYLLATSHHTAGLPPCVGWGHTGCHVPIREGSPQGDLSLAVPSASKPKEAEMADMSSRGKRKEIRMGTEPRLVPVTRMGWSPHRAETVLCKGWCTEAG